MSVIFLLITASTIVAAVFLAAFIKAVRGGQFDDDRSPAVRMLLEDDVRERIDSEVNGQGRTVNGKPGSVHSPFVLDHSPANVRPSPPASGPAIHHTAQPVAP